MFVVQFADGGDAAGHDEAAETNEEAVKQVKGQLSALWVKAVCLTRKSRSLMRRSLASPANPPPPGVTEERPIGSLGERGGANRPLSFCHSASYLLL